MKNMECAYCGNIVRGDSEHCPYCGSNLDEQKSEAFSLPGYYWAGIESHDEPDENVPFSSPSYFAKSYYVEGGKAPPPHRCFDFLELELKVWQSYDYTPSFFERLGHAIFAIGCIFRYPYIRQYKSKILWACKYVNSRDFFVAHTNGGRLRIFTQDRRSFMSLPLNVIAANYH